MQRKGASKLHRLPEQFPSGEILLQAQPRKKHWQLGEVIGRGGFGLVYKAFDMEEDPLYLASPCVIKVEPLGNGPLFCEFHFYQRAAKPDMITQWIQARKLQYLGVPQFLGSGQHQRGSRHYRFVILQRLSFNLQKFFVQNGRSFSEKSVFSIGLRMLDALEYIHEKGYCHADVKATNILLGFNNGNTDFNQVYLVDYGLASGYLVDGVHKPYKENPKRAHDGTTEYTSRDAHKGAYPSRRGDLEILGYCMLEWLTGGLPWDRVLHNKDQVHDLKIQYMNDIPGLLKACFGTKSYPDGLRKYLMLVSQLAYCAKPNYHQLRQFLRSGSGSEWTLGLLDGATHANVARGVKRRNESKGTTIPPRTKVRPTCSSAPSSPVVFQRAATGNSRPASSRSAATVPGSWLKSSSNWKPRPSANAAGTPAAAAAVRVIEQSRPRPSANAARTAAVRVCEQSRPILSANAARTAAVRVCEQSRPILSANGARTPAAVRVCEQSRPRPSANAVRTPAAVCVCEQSTPRSSANAVRTPAAAVRVSEESRKPSPSPKCAGVRMRRPAKVLAPCSSSKSSAAFGTSALQEDMMYYQESEVLQDERDDDDSTEEDIEDLSDIYSDEEEPYWRCHIL